MSFYRDEKKRIGYGRIGLCVTSWFFYFITLNSQIMTYRQPFLYALDEVKTVPPKDFSFYNFWLIIFGIILLEYLAKALFTTKEQGKRVLLIPKYTTVPISHKELYVAKVRIMAETLGIYMGGSMLVYGITLFFSKEYVRFTFQKSVLPMILTSFAYFIFLFGIVTIYRIQESISIVKK